MSKELSQKVVSHPLFNLLAQKLRKPLPDLIPYLLDFYQRLDRFADLILAGTDLPHGIPVTESECVVLDGLEIRRDAQGVPSSSRSARNACQCLLKSHLHGLRFRGGGV